MNYCVKCQNTDDDLLTRLLKIRNITDDPSRFLDPKLADYWLDPFALRDMEKAVWRILEALKNNEKIMIFWDYDVDGITSSYVLYSFLRDFLGHENVSIQYPDRKKDGYGLKTYHIDQIVDKWVNLIITVDNGITSIEEAKYAKEKWIDLIITDHHHALEIIPDAFAVINPKVSDKYKFKDLAGVGVAFKLVNAILLETNFSKEKKNQIFEYFLPLVAIGTVADVVPLVHENRVMVKKGLELMNFQKNKIPKSLLWFLDYLNIKKNIDTFHIWFVIWPRINAGWRIQSPYDSLNVLLYHWEKQLEYLQKIDEINTRRKKMQDEAIKYAKEIVNVEKNILIVDSEDFHEGIIGIVSWRISDQFNRPSMVLCIQKDEWQAVASLRWAPYFDVIKMIQSAEHLLERFGGHKWAGWLTVKLENLDALKKYFEDYCMECITDKYLEKVVEIDTHICEHEWEYETLAKIDQLAPFGQGNPEPVFLLENVKIEKVQKIWKNGNWHLKIHCIFWDKKLATMFRGKGAELDKFQKLKTINLIGKIKRDMYNGGYFVDGIHFVEVL